MITATILERVNAITYDKKYPFTPKCNCVKKTILSTAITNDDKTLQNEYVFIFSIPLRYSRKMVFALNDVT